MIYKGYKNIVALNILSNKPVMAVYKGSRLVWQAVRSCFGIGYWINDKPWINDEAWKNN